VGDIEELGDKLAESNSNTTYLAVSILMIKQISR